VGFTGPIGALTVEVIGLKSAPTGAEAVVVAAYKRSKQNDS